MTAISRIFAVMGLSCLTACGTTYSLPTVGAGAQEEARAMFAEEQTRGLPGNASPREAAARFKRVVAKVRPVAVAFCKGQATGAKTCDLPIIIDEEMQVPNAYQTRTKDGQPYIAISIPMLATVRNDDELAFILSHEYAHHIADHLQKGEQQAMAGALILGVITAAGQSYATQANPYRYTGNDQAELNRNMELGAAAGNQAFSQTYELESDVLAAHIARGAGYDPVKGARFFARPAAAKTTAGNLSFWGTHPPDAVRLATVIEAAKAAESGEGLKRKQ